MKVFLAGTYSENKNAEDVLQSMYNLESFYYIKPWQYEMIHKSKMFLLDSGAFTFFSSGKKIDWDEYIKKYANFIKENNVSYFFELDIDSLVGYEKVKQLRRGLETETGRKCIPVWHKSRGIKEWISMCDEYDYVAIGGIASKDIKPAEYKAFPAMIKEAHNRGAQVHGLGFTNISKLPLYHFDSVDSTRWNCARFGRIEYFDGKTIRAIDRRSEGKRLAGRKNNDIIKFTFREWIKFQKYAETHL